jgi:hypothetical protein
VSPTFRLAEFPLMAGVISTAFPIILETFLPLADRKIQTVVIMVRN